MKDSNENKVKLWGGRFNNQTSKVTEKISLSLHFDKRLYHHDIKGSLAHAYMLFKKGIINELSYNNIVKGLKQIKDEIEQGKFNFDSTFEDIHMNIEKRLIEIIGNDGKRLHTARSRNDQVVTDVRMFLKDNILIIKNLLVQLINSMLKLAEENMDVIMPGYTHLQIAQPVRFSHHMLAYSWAFLRDLSRLENAYKSSDCLPLGSGALAGVNYENDRFMLAEQLEFKDIIHNSMDAVSDRDFILDFLYFSSVFGMHCSRLCEDIILWSTAEFSFIELSDSVTTGSSIMPQKRNPDIAELIRGKSGRLYGNLIALLTVMKGLPMTYNRDLQEDKEPLFDSVDTVALIAEALNEMISNMKVKRQQTKNAVYRNFSTATDIADYLVMKGLPFRQAHHIVGNIVKFCETNNVDFFSLKIEQLKQFSDSFDEDVLEFIDPEKSIERKKSYGSTSKSSIINQIKLIKEKLNECSN